MAKPDQNPAFPYPVRALTTAVKLPMALIKQSPFLLACLWQGKPCGLYLGVQARSSLGQGQIQGSLFWSGWATWEGWDPFLSLRSLNVKGII